MTSGGRTARDIRDFMAVVVRSTLDTARLQESIRKAVLAFDRDQALADIRSLDQRKSDYSASSHRIQ